MGGDLATEPILTEWTFDNFENLDSYSLWCYPTDNLMDPG